MIRTVAFVTLLCACCLLSKPFAVADPGEDGCSNVCQNKYNFIFVVTGKLQCTKYEEKKGYCLSCTKGRCKDPAGPTLPKCLPSAEQIASWGYPGNACVPICNLLVDQSAEATVATGDPTISGPVTRTLCSE